VPPSPTFAELGVESSLVLVLESQGIEHPFEVQALTIPDALAGRDVCGKAKTGSGKTLAFGLPMLMMTPRSIPGRPASLVLVPTRELALQVTTVLLPLGEAVSRRVGAVYGGADLDAQVRLISEGLDVVVATPGRLIDLADRGAISLEDIGILVVDEADRMADMGFLPQVEWLLRRMSRRHQTMLFSATLDSAIDQLVRRYLDEPVFHEVLSLQVTVAEMEHHFFKVHQLDKDKVLATIIGGADKTLVFVRTKRSADQVAQQLVKMGIRAAAIHGDLRQKSRERAISDFKKGRLVALVATDVAARGLHVEGVDVVVHYNPPEDYKSYLHRSGRTARAGEAGVAITLVLWNEELAAERLQRRLGLSVPIEEVFSNDPRLTLLAPSSIKAAQEALT
jgi:superfamily II DNA/RNA helicase